MKIIRFLDGNQTIKYAAQQADGRALEISGDIFGSYSVTDRKAQVAKLLAPIAPTNLLCVGLNYRQHAIETKLQIPEYPVLFIKTTGAVQNPGDPILMPTKLRSAEVDYECELAVVIGKSCKNATRETALDYVLGYTCANDVSTRDWQFKWSSGQWCRSKTFDTFAPLGPCLVTTDEIRNPNELDIRMDINGEMLQHSNTNDMIFDIPRLIEFLSSDTTLPPGTVILTGTPQGVGMARKPPRYLKAGDVATVTIEKIGSLTNPVVDEAG
jgi:2-keto-4-pentenoate hydratase/2-oxohepta-3-ene-1,7-dioic acid hydratase in catechol pathway